MDKIEFLSKLEQSLSVLEEEELRDFISEYEQHIDMKTQTGLTEEEAIADFGSFQELRVEILEAYHVRADYADKTGKSRNKSKGIARQETTENLERLKGIGTRESHTLWNGIKEVGAWIWNGFQWCWRQVCRPFSWARERLRAISSLQGDRKDEEGVDAALKVQGLEETADFGESIQKNTQSGKKKNLMYNRRRKQKIVGGNHMRAVERTESIIGSGSRAIGKGINGIFRWTIDMVFLGIRVMWNSCWILFSLFTAGFGLLSLFGMGVLIVLLLDGYPLMGVTLGCLGLVLCMFSATGLGVTLLQRRKREEQLENPRQNNIMERKKRLGNQLTEEGGQDA